MNKSYTFTSRTNQPHKPKLVKEYAFPTHKDTVNLTKIIDKHKSTGYNSTYKKLAVQWLNEALCFVSSFVVADSFVLRNRQLLVAANR